MSAHNRVIWSEGLFLEPQHFQQQERYFERYVEARCHSLVPHSWGFTEVEFERDLLAIGKVALRRAAGVFPDGTPFQLPDDDPLPTPIDMGVDVRDQLVFLAVPLRRAGEVDADRDGGADGLVRYAIREVHAHNATSAAGGPAVLEVGVLRTRLMLEKDVSQAYACIPLARIVECRADGQVVVDDAFIPTVLEVRAAARLAAFARELSGLLHQRGEALAGRVTATGRGGAAEFAEYLMLQAINRSEPLVAHITESANVHPELFFQLCVTVLGEFATFLSTSKRPPKIPVYRHDRLRECFEPVMIALRELFGRETVDRVVPIPIKPGRFGISVAVVHDRALFESAVFILAARADVPSEELRRRFPSQLKIGPADRIGDLVRLALPGLPVQAVPVAPRQIPFHAGFAYFELDQSDDLWKEIKNAAGIGMHVAGEFPNLAMEFWAIRS
jgi:type VI secretion system protein ImpJ